MKQFLFGLLKLRFDAFLFDMDGTLVDSEVEFRQAWHVILGRRGIDLALFRYDEFRGCGGDEQAIKVIESHGLPDDPHALLQEWVIVARALVFANVKLCRGAESILKFCEEGEIPKALVTSSSGVYTEKLLTQIGLIDHFRFLVTRTTMEMLGTKSKPAPYPYLLACWRFGIDPSRALVFEDSVVGVKSAKAAGCPTIGITHGDTNIAKQLHAVGADILVDTLNNLALDLVAQLP